MRLRKFKREDMALYTGYGGNEERIALSMALSPELLTEAEANEGYSGFIGSDFIGACGFVEITPYRALCWCLLHPKNPLYLVAIHRVALKLLEGANKRFPRLECHVDPGFSAALRWAKMLGFQQEGGVRPYFFPDGTPGTEWVRIRGGENDGISGRRANAGHGSGARGLANPGGRSGSGSGL